MYRTSKPTLAIHLIWTTYGTWLPGDERGHWSPLFNLYGQILSGGDKLNPPDQKTYDYVKSKMSEPERILSAQEVVIVADQIGAMISGKTKCFAAAIEPSHVHLLIGILTEDLQQFIGRLKGTISSALLKLPINSGRKRTWTDGYWKRFLTDMEGVHGVRKYIEAHNERRGMANSPWNWITPT